MRKFLASAAILAFVAAPAFAADTVDTESAAFTLDVAEDCTIQNDPASQVITLGSASTFAIVVECNTEFSLAMADDAAGTAADLITMNNTENLESIAPYTGTFTGVVTSDKASLAAGGGAVAGDHAAQDATVTYSVAWSVANDTTLEAGDYAGSGTVTLTGTDV